MQSLRLIPGNYATALARLLRAWLSQQTPEQLRLTNEMGYCLNWMT